MSIDLSDEMETLLITQ